MKDPNSPSSPKKRASPKKSTRASPGKSKSGKPLVPCKPGQIRNPKTNRCMKDPNSPSSPKKLTRASPKNLPRAPSPYRSTPKIVHAGKVNSSCITRSKMKLRDIQIRAVEYIDKNRGLLLVHGTGAGKTLTAVAASQCYLDKNPSNRVVFIGPSSLLSNFLKELNGYGATNLDKYERYSFDTVLSMSKTGRTINCKNKMLIVDEAHNLRNIKSKKGNLVYDCAAKAEKVLLLTATPFVNKPHDMEPLINMLYGKRVIGSSKEYNEGVVKGYLKVDNKEGTHDEHNIETIVRLLQGRVYYVSSAKMKDFPLRKDIIKYINMSDSYYQAYNKQLESLLSPRSRLFKDPTRFYNGHRRAVNKAGNEYFSEKVKSVIPIIKEGKTVIYTNWLEFGVDPITNILEKEGLTYKVFTGEVSATNKEKIVNEFNKDKFDVLIITKSGGEGIDLKGVKSIIVLEPTWNDANLQQIIGRAIRYKSHAHLPEKDRSVNVYLLILTAPEGAIDGELSGDEILYSIIERKKEKEEKLYEKLIQESILTFGKN